jgi:hypothetical protein
VAAAFQVNTLGDTQLDPAIAGNAAGNFLAVWESFTSNGSDITSWSEVT